MDFHAPSNSPGLLFLENAVRHRPVVSGKVLRLPGLDRYDAMKPAEEAEASSPLVTVAYKASLVLDRLVGDKDADRALLVALGVDGRVPYEIAVRNASIERRAANDNRKSAAVAA